MGRELTGRRCAGGAEGAGGAGLVRGAAARWAGDAAVPRSAPCGRRGRELALPGGRCRWEPSCLRSDSCAALIPGSRGAGRRTPRPWGRGQRRCRRRQKPRRCESGGLRAPFLCRETESGLEGARRLAPPAPGVPRPVGPSRVRARRVQKPELSVTRASCPFWEGGEVNNPLLAQEPRGCLSTFRNGFLPLYPTFLGGGVREG